MKARAINLKGLEIAAVIVTVLISWGVVSAAPFHYYGDGERAVDCIDCHDVSGTSGNVSLIADYIVSGWNDPDGTPTMEQVVFLSPHVSPFDWVDGNGSGICEVCHDETNYWRTDGTSPGGGHHSGGDCSNCHTHCNEFLHGAAGSGCGQSGCHGQDGGAGTVQSHTVHTENDDPHEQKGPQTTMACGDCHDLNMIPYFVYDVGQDTNSDGVVDLSETTVCDPCHSESGAYDGSVMVKAAGAWTDGIYETDGTLKSGYEDGTLGYWCASCHDSDQAVIDGQTAPNIAGDDLQTYGFYVNGHGTTDPFNATMHGQNGPGYGCTVCHDPSLTHISDTVNDPRLESVTGDALDYTSASSEVCLDCHLVGQTDPGDLGADATAEASVHSGGVNDRFNTSGTAPDAFPAYGGSADYATNPGYQCADCHSPHGTQKLAMVNATIDGNLGGVSNPIDLGVDVFKYDQTDLTDLDPTAAADDGVCDTCHTVTGDPHPDSNHPGNHNVGNTGDSCMVCHQHGSSFAHAGGAGTGCGDPGCHGQAGGAGTEQGHGTHTGGLNKGPDALLCEGCHDTNNFPLFGADDAQETLAATTVCDACHSPDTPYPESDGLMNAAIGAKANWRVDANDSSSGIYESDGVTLRTGKEKWCATCHDDPPASSSIPSSSTQIVVDDPAASVVPDCTPGSCNRYSEWEYWAGNTPYGSGVRYMATKSLTPGGAVDGEVTYTPTIPEAGEYNVYAWWDSSSGDAKRSSSVPYTIYYNDGTDSVQVPVDQTDNGGQWNLLATLNFDAGTSCYVELSNDAPQGTDPTTTWVIADAILFTKGVAVGSTEAPIVAGDNVDYGFYVTGHGPSGVFHCLDCHDTSIDHIDHAHRTYSRGSNNYQAGYRLRSVDDKEPMKIPRDTGDPQAHWNDFRLCFDCHNRNEVLGVNMEDVSHTNFVHDEDNPDKNSHYFHLEKRRVAFDSDFNGSLDSAFTCTSCHNVHGSPSPMMIRHGELINVNRGEDFPPDFAALNFFYLPLGSDLENSTAGRMDHGGASPEKNGVCQACHGIGTSYRNPAFMGPKVIAPTAEPGSVTLGVETDVLLTVFILDHSDPFDVSTVTIDLSPVLGPGYEAVAMYDDGDDVIDESGTDSGDRDAGDGIYSHLATIPDTVGSGQYDLPVTATDASSTGTNIVELPVVAAPIPGVVIVDDPDAAFDPDCTPGSCDRYSQWEYWDGETPYGTGVRYMAIKSLTPGGAIDGTATWTPALTSTGEYNVYAWWDSKTGDAKRSSSVTYTIYYNDGTDSIQVPADQTENGGQWNLLDTLNFDAGTSCYVELSNDAPQGTGTDTWVIADAIKFNPAGLTYVISGQITDDAVGVDGVTVSISGDITDSTVTAGGGNYSFTVPNGNYTVTPRLVPYDFTPASRDVQVSGGPKTADFTADWTGIVDDPDAAFVPDCTPGSCDRYSQWEYWNGEIPYGTGVRFMAIKSLTPGGAIDGTATWAPAIPATGQYNVYAWWDSSTGDQKRSSSVTYTIHYNDGMDSVQVPADQTENGGQWNLLDTLDFDAGTSCYVELSNDAPQGTGTDTWVIADAIWWEPVP
jgi:hypothetical protein